MAATNTAMKVLEKLQDAIAPAAAGEQPDTAAPQAAPAAEREEVLSLLRSADLLARLADDNETLRGQCESFARSADIANTENERLLREVKRAKAERDHYLKAYTALKAQLNFIGAGVLEAIKAAEVHAYEPRPPGAMAAGAGAAASAATSEPPPKFLTSGREATLGSKAS